MNKKGLVEINKITSKQIASICDHTFLKRTEQYNEEAKKQKVHPAKLRKVELFSFLRKTFESYYPYALCVRPEDVKFVESYINTPAPSGIVIASVVGFPDGSHYSSEFKIAETKLAIDSGAKEIDMVLNYEKFKEKGNHDSIDYVGKEIESIANLCHKNNVLLKLIFENSELDEEDIFRACNLAMTCEADFIKTSTGFDRGYGAKEKDLKIMRANFEDGIKISGGVNKNNVKDLLYAASGKNDGYIDLDPKQIRIGESSLLKSLSESKKDSDY